MLIKRYSNRKTSPFALDYWFRWWCWVSETLPWSTSVWDSYEMVPLAEAGLREDQPVLDHCYGVHARACLKKRDEKDLVNSIFPCISLQKLEYLHYGAIRHPSHMATDNKQNTSAQFPRFPIERPFSVPQKCDRDTVVHLCLTQSHFL